MKQKLLILLIGVFLCSIISVQAQIRKTVSWDFSTEQVSSNEVNLVFTAKIDNEWHLYSQHFPDGGPIRFSATFTDSDNYELIGDLEEITKPKSEYDDIFEMDIQYFVGGAVLKQKVKLLSKSAFSVEGEMEYQTCREGECVMYTPDFEFKLNVGKKAASIESSAQVKEKINPMKNPRKEYTSLWSLFFISFSFGLIALLTPCVFPMIPMTVSFFMHSSENRRKAIFNAIVYGVSIIGIYTIIGTIVAVTLGPSFANWLSTHWIPNILFFIIFLFFAFSFFGMFEITMPSWIVNKSVSNEDKGGIAGSFFMAFTLVLVSFSCTGPIVGSILVQSAGGEVLEPIVGMFGFSLAFALPFTLFAIFPSWLNNLPKSGGWLNSVKVILGFLELALGLKFLSIADQTYGWGLLDREIYLGIWIVIFTLMGFYLLGKLKFSHDSDVKFVSVPRLMLAIASFSFVVFMIPGMFGAPLKAISGYLPPQTTQDFDISAIVRNQSGAVSENELCEAPKYAERLHLPHGLKGYFDFEQGIACAKEQNKPVFIDFTGHGCVNCREMEANVWSDPRVQKILREDYVIIALYVDDKQTLPESDWITSSYDGKVKKTLGRKYADFQITRFGVNAQPYYVLLDKEEDTLVDPRAYDLNAEAFVEFLENGKREFKNR
ncbi:protein-disulfide reductase DsbD family protein [Labilibaculum antarcticum]|uniref:Disulfide bond formation protein DsbD n=1 Tax=Labilibaculum antarcticum TaxID=1717717 RepID=A0A1Y1CGU0_9BACT|nr:cytochrome c biogenesis protein CcdA [Labilibaculum antarcticum]BAX79500.1 disulfide bond formation protein DsbD [Labilibaculum antarcticum]